MSFFDLTQAELKGIFLLAKTLKEKIGERYGALDFNIGINDGKNAGRSVDHLHIHLIPRYKGDVQNPTGGIRHILEKNREFMKEIIEHKV